MKKRLWLYLGLGLFWGITVAVLFALATKPHQYLLGGVIGIIIFCAAWLYGAVQVERKE